MLVRNDLPYMKCLTTSILVVGIALVIYYGAKSLFDFSVPFSDWDKGSQILAWIILGGGLVFMFGTVGLKVITDNDVMPYGVTKTSDIWFWIIMAALGLAVVLKVLGIW